MAQNLIGNVKGLGFLHRLHHPSSSSSPFTVNCKLGFQPRVVALSNSATGRNLYLNPQHLFLREDFEDGMRMVANRSSRSDVLGYNIGSITCGGGKTECASGNRSSDSVAFNPSSSSPWYPSVSQRGSLDSISGRNGAVPDGDKVGEDRNDEGVIEENKVVVGVFGDDNEVEERDEVRGRVGRRGEVHLDNVEVGDREFGMVNSRNPKSISLVRLLRAMPPWSLRFANLYEVGEPFRHESFAPTLRVTTQPFPPLQNEKP
ncbi:hypothetical protein V8G54_011415 [Vigna mungo]|uniref:Uncharacterized protein n=1 Tax=Vigna mungo TaxID=3915 RepID=A0AAQ3S312_VIGMU